MADFLDVQSGNDKRKQLLAWLMQQTQQGGSNGMASGALQAASAALPSNLSSIGGGGLRTIFNRADTRPTHPNVTQGTHVHPGLGALLGPGGFGTPGAYDHSHAPGLPVAPPQRMASPGRVGPHSGQSILPVGPPNMNPLPPPFMQTQRPNQAAQGLIYFDPNDLILKRIP